MISLKERDPKLAQKIISKELPGVLNWSIDGLNRLLKNKCFTESLTMQNAAQQYQIDADSVLAFLTETDTNSGSHLMKGSDLFQRYKDYCNDCSRPPLGRSKFFLRLERQGFEKTMKNKQIHFGVHRALNPISSGYREKNLNEHG